MEVELTLTYSAIKNNMIVDSKVQFCDLYIRVNQILCETKGKRSVHSHHWKYALSYSLKENTISRLPETSLWQLGNFNLTSMHLNLKELFSFLCLSCFFFLALADPRRSKADLYCGKSRTTPQQNIPKFGGRMEVISSLVDKQGWGTQENGSDPAMYNLAQCMNDLSHTDCLLCFTEARTTLPRCIPSVSARVYLDGCFLRWDTYNFYGEAMDNQTDKRVCNSSSVENHLKAEFSDRAKEVIANVTGSAAKKRGFAVAKTTKGNVSVYALAQCWKTVDMTGCQNCLEKAAREVNQCLPGIEGRGLNAGCYLRYSTEKFYTEKPYTEKLHTENFYDDPHVYDNDIIARKQRSSLKLVLSVTVPVVSVLALVSTITFYLRRKKEMKSLNDDQVIWTAESLQFNFKTVRDATNNFSDANKLGKGGFGIVYKGLLLDGREIAVKRLSSNSSQGIQEFKNEVLLIVKLQHRNLVKLLGFCLEGNEKLLIYEFAPNASLDHYIFDPTKCTYLDWERRHKIIGGIARGLIYLHEDSRHRIIHRDLKAGNVLLDEQMEPKISDFGMARLFKVDQIQGSTARIVGTYGYMAPEYAMHGQFSVKSDVFSFGVLVLEIITGQKNKVFFQSEYAKDLLSYAWRHWGEGRALDLIEPALKDQYSVSEVMRCIHVGLLCVQEDAALRPRMATVVHMLDTHSVTLASPSTPAFFVNTREQGGNGESAKPHSINEVSLTQLHPR